MKKLVTEVVVGDTLIPWGMVRVGFTVADIVHEEGMNGDDYCLNFQRHDKNGEQVRGGMTFIITEGSPVPLVMVEG